MAHSSGTTDFSRSSAAHIATPLRSGCFRLTPDQRAVATNRRRLQRDFDAAVEADCFVMHFQPRWSLASGAVLGAEALILWPHRKFGLIGAADFLPLAEQAGTIVRIGGWMLQQSCREATAEIDPWPQSWTVSVKISARQMDDGTLLQQVAQALDQTGLPPERLEIEMAESMLADISIDTLLTLSALRDLGVGLALDDFGTGFASLTMLKRLPLTAMKLDKSLVRELPHDREDAAIVRAIIGAGHALGLDIIADGIETEAQRAFLSASGCDAGQGALFSTKLPPDKLRAWITNT